MANDRGTRIRRSHAGGRCPPVCQRALGRAFRCPAHDATGGDGGRLSSGRRADDRPLPRARHHATCRRHRGFGRRNRRRRTDLQYGGALAPGGLDVGGRWAAGWLLLRDWPHAVLVAVLVPWWLAGEWT